MCEAPAPAMATDFEAEGLLDGLEDERQRNARLELLRQLESEGVPLGELRRAVEEGRLALLPVERALEGEGRRYTAQEIAELSGLDRAFQDRVWHALGMALAPEDEKTYDDGDLEAARNAKRFLDLGMPEEGILEIGQVMGHSMAAVANAITQVFGQAFLEAGDTERDLGLRYAQAAEAMTPLIGPSLEHVLLIHQRAAARQAVMYEEEFASGRLQGIPITTCFADLVGFTRLGEAVPADELGSVARQLTDLAMEVASPDVQLVKSIGDAAMLVSRDPDAMLVSALELIEAADAQGEGFPQVHAGLAHGEALPRAGDWYGHPVNLASRIADFARPGSVVAAKEVQEAAKGNYSWSRAGRRKFKGVKGEVTVFRVRRPEPATSD
jgi:adenylate cyclase